MTGNTTPAEAVEAAVTAFNSTPANGLYVREKLVAAIRAAAPVIAARAAAAQLAADIKLAIDHNAVCWREPPPHAVADGGDWRPFADLLAAAPEERP